jgi:hypothetical protein
MSTIQSPTKIRGNLEIQFYNTEQKVLDHSFFQFSFTFGIPIILFDNHEIIEIDID